MTSKVGLQAGPASGFQHRSIDPATTDLSCFVVIWRYTGRCLFVRWNTYQEIVRQWFLGRTIQFFAGFDVVIDRFFKSGTKFCNRFNMKTDDIANACNMTDKATVVLTILNSSSISLICHLADAATKN